MATSGSKTLQIYTWCSLKFSWEQKNQSVENNSTTISWRLDFITTSGALYVYSKPWEVSIDDQNFSGTSHVLVDENSSTTVASGTATIPHNDNGSKTFSYSFKMTFNVTLNSGKYMGSFSSSGSNALETIARASQPSCITYPSHTQNVGSFGDTISIHMNRKSSAFTHTVRYEFGSKSGTCIDADTGKAATGVTNGIKWKIPLDFMNLLPADTYGSGTIYVDTYNGSTKIGTKYCGFTATVPASVKPTCAFTLEDVTGNDAIYGSPVKSLSRIKIVATADPVYSSPIVAYSITANGVKYPDSTATTGALLTSGTSRVTVTVTDKRGRSGSSSYDMNVQDYTAPAITALAVHRCDEDGTANDRGEYVKVTFSAAVSSMSNKNNATYRLQYKKSSVTSYTSVSLAELVNKLTVSNYSYIFAADGSSSYDVEILVSDRHNTSSRSTSASTAFTLLNFHPSGDGLRFGGVAEKENTLQNDLDLRQVGNTYAFQPESFNGEKGYTLLAEISLTALNVNAPIVFVINRRGAIAPMKVNIRFASSSSTTDPDLGSITYEGDNYGAFLYRSAESTWRLYVDNTSGWSNPCLQSWYTTGNQMARMSVTFPNEQVSALPTPYWRATPAVLRSILDCFFPVGFVLTLYSHADPNEMYPGTEWVRITNAFLWAVDSSGTIGLTGGEKAVTLTTNEMPKHSHGSVYSQHAAGTKDKAWYNTAGTEVAYGAVEAGGGAAHNNMPPYIQVSVWRRTS